MSSECTWSVPVMLCFILAAGAHGGPLCTVKSSAGKEVLLGSNFTISCTFNKECTKQIFQNMEQISYEQFPKSSVVSVKNLTEFSVFVCKCKENPEPCGIDITPGYPPDIPQNLTCIRKTEFGNVSCTWTTGRDTKIKTTCQLRVQGDPHLSYESFMLSTGLCLSTFPIESSKMSQLVVSLNVSNSLGSKTSGPHTFTLRNIVKPSIPQISHVNCSSQWCHLHTDNHSMDLFEVQYRAVNGIWKTFETSTKMNWNITSLQPDTKYKFKIRRKIYHRVGLWSDWSQEKETITEEEAPVKELDVWYLQEPKTLQSGNKCFHIFWKELNISDAKGKILKYNISVLEQKSNSKSPIPPRKKNYICCSNCSVSVSAVNSKGQSPAKFTELHSPGFASGFLPQPHKLLNNHSVALSWQRPAIADQKTEYVVHWYPVGYIERIQWIRVLNTTANITGLQPHQCYQGAVTALQTSGPIMAHIRGISTWQSAPEQGPVPQPLLKNTESLQVKWSEIPQEKRRGCLKKYTIYLWNKLTRDTQTYSVDYPKKQYTISGLSPGQCYNLWVTAWTDAGEGPRGSDLPFCTPTDAEKLLSHVILAGGAVLLACLILLCICQFSSVQKRCLSCCQCLLPTVIPDPANSNCAKTYTDDQGEIKFYLHKYDPSVSEDPENVEVEEVPYPSFPCTYIKSFSQESSSSDATQSTRTTDYTDDYISTHGAISGGEEEEDQEEEACLDEFEFFPSTQSPFLEPLVLTGGKLTLDAVKIDCSEFLDCT
ncbi:interleukin-12 receptor subunit beta-2 isoform X1 [Ctenopharyngodon idella]|uniref:interleukin-12 receptor subunit beta-2 isoform X1 n=1 Tax=Ctenopharyngodon idella TaxID=7959 RepID=UPI00222E3DE0|nr:interleukin-12 receptor subunit beta-2 isoform X1 [Ctenopharyngodon idella]XP_051752448.1 interleukin-12 receptor subunit beta-2 isoform X1 [Ctenopharyngodon idella]